MGEDAPAPEPDKKKDRATIVDIVLTVLVGLTLPRVGKLVAFVFIAALTSVLLTTTIVRIVTHAPQENATLGQQKLLNLHTALRKFQSEQYFARLPKNLAELVNLPPQESFVDGRLLVVNGSPLLEANALTLAESAPPTGSDPDFWLVPYYSPFLPDKMIILLDRPGNYQNGGNVVFNDGAIVFLAMASGEYRRFAQAVMERRDRNFVRDHSADCALVGFQE